MPYSPRPAPGLINSCPVFGLLRRTRRSDPRPRGERPPRLAIREPRWLRPLAGILCVLDCLAISTSADAVPLWQAVPCPERLDATYYHPSLTGEVMANGQPYDPRNVRLASSNRHRLGALLRLTRADRPAGAVVVEVMDRGSEHLGLDLSEAAFEQLAPLREGRVAICVEMLR
jgi:hypothetical protein